MIISRPELELMGCLVEDSITINQLKSLSGYSIQELKYHLDNLKNKGLVYCRDTVELTESGLEVYESSMDCPEYTSDLEGVNEINKFLDEHAELVNMLQMMVEVANGIDSAEYFPTVPLDLAQDLLNRIQGEE